MPSAFITGITGQDGWYLASRLIADGYAVRGIARHDGDVPPGAILHRGDVRDESLLQSLIEEVAPAEVYHLAAASSVEQSWAAPDRARDDHREGLRAILRAVFRGAPRAHVVVASSSEVFGATTVVPQNEQTPLAPASPYGAGKAAALELIRHTRREGAHRVSAAILYNHESIRRPVRFLSRKVTAGVAAIALGKSGSLQLGNLDSRRDWGYAPDYVEAMRRMARQSRGGDYVVGTGVSRSVRDLCEAAFGAAGLDYREFVTSDPALVRGVDPVTLVADATHARRTLAWEPTITFEGMVAAMVKADIARLRSEEGC